MLTRKDDITDFASLLRDHIFVDLVDNCDGMYDTDAPRIPNLLRIQVDDYNPAEDEKWDVDKWEARQSVLLAPPSRKTWKIVWAVARKLAAGKNAFVDAANGKNICIRIPDQVVISCA